MTSLAMALVLEPGRREQRSSWRSKSGGIFLNAGADGLLSTDLTICEEIIVRGSSISVDCAVHNPVRVEATASIVFALQAQCIISSVCSTSMDTKGGTERQPEAITWLMRKIKSM